MVKMRDFFKKIVDTKGTFLTRMGTIKNRNCTDLQKQKRLRRDGKNTQKNYTKEVLMTQLWHGHSLRADILECEVKWALGSVLRNKASGGDGIPAELFKILEDDAVKVLHSICQQI